MNKGILIGAIVVVVIIIGAVYGISYDEPIIEVSEDTTSPLVTETPTNTSKHYTIELQDGVGVSEP